MEKSSRLISCCLAVVAVAAGAVVFAKAPTGEQFQLTSGTEIHQNTTRGAVRVTGRLIQVRYDDDMVVGVLSVETLDNQIITVLANIPQDQLQNLAVSGTYEFRGNISQPGTIGVRNRSNIISQPGTGSELVTVRPYRIYRRTESTGTMTLINVESGTQSSYAISAPFPLKADSTYLGYWTSRADSELRTFRATQIITGDS